MPAKPKNSIADRLNAAQVAISNSLADEEIKNLVGAYGYSAAKLNAGKALYTAAVDAANHATAASGAQQQATVVVESAGDIARDAFQALAKIARAALKDNPGQLTALTLDGPMPRTMASFLSNAKTMFENALNIPEIQTALAEFGYTAQKLQTECAKITNYDLANQAQELAKGAAQQATQLQDAALAEMDDWVACYLKVAKVALRDDSQLLEKIGILSRTSKTAAQRAAPAKAEAKRAAKAKAS